LKLFLLFRVDRAHRDAERVGRIRERLLGGPLVGEPLHADVAIHPADEVLLLDETQAAKGWIGLLTGAFFLPQTQTLTI
jgi:hypothetical protein